MAFQRMGNQAMSESILREIDWTDKRTEKLRSFLIGHKVAMLHCDEELIDEFGICECLLRLAEWYAETMGWADKEPHEKAARLLKKQESIDPKERFQQLVDFGLIDTEGRLRKEYGGDA